MVDDSLWSCSLFFWINVIWWISPLWSCSLFFWICNLMDITHVQIHPYDTRKIWGLLGKTAENERKHVRFNLVCWVNLFSIFPSETNPFPLPPIMHLNLNTLSPNYDQLPLIIYQVCLPLLEYHYQCFNSIVFALSMDSTSQLSMLII